MAGFATKAGLVPFHGWLADVHTATSGPVSALFSGLMYNFGIVAIGRLAFQVFGVTRIPILGLLLTVGIISALLGAVMALAQDDLKRLLAYDTISQMGILAIGLGTGTAPGIAGAVYHLVNHALFKSLLFLCAGAILHRTGLTKLSDMGGLARRMPAVAVAFVIGAASIAGIPPFNGYVSLSLIHTGLLDSHQYLPYALMLAAQVITIAALGKAAWLAFFRPRAAGLPAAGAVAPRHGGRARQPGCVLRRVRRAPPVLPRFGDGAGRRQPAASGPLRQRRAHRPGPAARAAPAAVRLCLAGRADHPGGLRRCRGRARLGVSPGS